VGERGMKEVAGWLGQSPPVKPGIDFIYLFFQESIKDAFSCFMSSPIF
jgi:hypothetical protein